MLDFTDDAESALLDWQTVKMVTDDLRIEGEAEIKLELTPIPGVYLYGVFNEPRLLAAMNTAMSEPESMYLFDRYGKRIEAGPAESSWSPGTLKLKWRVLAEPIKVVGDDNTQMTQLVTHVFNTADTEHWLPESKDEWQQNGENPRWEGNGTKR